MVSVVRMRSPRLSTITLASALLVSGRSLATPPPIEVADGAFSGSLPKGVTLSPDGARLYVTNYGYANRRNVSVYDAQNLHRVATWDVPGIVVESAISPDGRTVYVSNFTRNTVQFLDANDGRVLREVHAGSHPKILVLSHDGTRLFAANWGGASVTEIDTVSGDVVRTLRAGRNPRGMAITRDGRLYIANFNGHSIDVYDGPERSQHHRLDDVCHIPRHLVLSPDEHTLYISCFSASELAAMDTTTEQIEHRVSVGTWPKAVDVSRDGRYVYTANYGGSSVSVVDTTDWSSITLDVPAMDHASGVVAASEGYRFYVTGWYDGHLFAIDAAGRGPGYSISRARQALTLRQREYHRLHPAE
jgi:DNA-binding beta-propeller fold protein YncE